MSHVVQPHPRRTGRSEGSWKNVIHWRREWQTTPVYLLWEPHELHKKAKRNYHMIQQFYFWVFTQKIWRRFQRAICTLMFRAAQFTIAKRWKQPRCPSTDEWINKLSIHTMDYHWALTRKETLTPATTYRDFEIIKWNKPVTKRQILNDSIYIRNLKQSNSHRQKAEGCWAGSGRTGEWGSSV